MKVKSDEDEKSDKDQERERNRQRESLLDSLPCVLSERSRVCRQNDRVSCDTGVFTAHTGAF